MPTNEDQVIDTVYTRTGKLLPGFAGSQTTPPQRTLKKLVKIIHVAEAHGFDYGDDDDIDYDAPRQHCQMDLRPESSMSTQSQPPVRRVLCRKSALVHVDPAKYDIGVLLGHGREVEQQQRNKENSGNSTPIGNGSRTFSVSTPTASTKKIIEVSTPAASSFVPLKKTEATSSRPKQPAYDKDEIRKYMLEKKKRRPQPTSSPDRAHEPKAKRYNPQVIQSYIKDKTSQRESLSQQQARLERDEKELIKQRLGELNIYRKRQRDITSKRKQIEVETEDLERPISRSDSAINEAVMHYAPRPVIPEIHEVAEPLAEAPVVVARAQIPDPLDSRLDRILSATESLCQRIQRLSEVKIEVREEPLLADESMIPDVDITLAKDDAAQFETTRDELLSEASQSVDDDSLSFTVVPYDEITVLNILDRLIKERGIDLRPQGEVPFPSYAEAVPTEVAEVVPSVEAPVPVIPDAALATSAVLEAPPIPTVTERVSTVAQAETEEPSESSIASEVSHISSAEDAASPAVVPPLVEILPLQEQPLSPAKVLSQAMSSHLEMLDLIEDSQRRLIDIQSRSTSPSKPAQHDLPPQGQLYPSYPAIDVEESPALPEFADMTLKMIEKFVAKEKSRFREQELLLNLREKTIEAHVQAELTWIKQQRRRENPDDPVGQQLEKTMMMRLASEKADINRIRKQLREESMSRKKIAVKAQVQALHKHVASTTALDEEIDVDLVLSKQLDKDESAPNSVEASAAGYSMDFEEQSISERISGSGSRSEVETSIGSESFKDARESIISAESSTLTEDQVDDSSLKALMSKLKELKKKTDDTNTARKERTFRLTKELTKELLDKRKKKILWEENLKLEIDHVNHILDQALTQDGSVSSLDVSIAKDEPISESEASSFSEKLAAVTGQTSIKADTVAHGESQDSIHEAIHEESSVESSEIKEHLDGSISEELGHEVSLNGHLDFSFSKSSTSEAANEMIRRIRNLQEQVEETQVRTRELYKQKDLKQQELNKSLKDREEQLKRKLQSIRAESEKLETELSTDDGIDDDIQGNDGDGDFTIPAILLVDSRKTDAPAEVTSVQEAIEVVEEADDIQEQIQAETIVEVPLKPIVFQPKIEEPQPVTEALGLIPEPKVSNFKETIVEAKAPAAEAVAIKKSASTKEITPDWTVPSMAVTDALLDDLITESLLIHKSIPAHTKVLSKSQNSLQNLFTATFDLAYIQKFGVMLLDHIPAQQSLLEPFRIPKAALDRVNNQTRSTESMISFNTLVFDCINEAISDVIQVEDKQENLPKYLRHVPLQRLKKHTVDSLKQEILRTLETWANYQQSKHKDDIAAVLAEEIAREEREWLSLDKYNGYVQDKIVELLFSDLLVDTVAALDTLAVK